MCWTGLSEEEVQKEDEEPEAQDIKDPVMDLTRGERESSRDTVAVTERVSDLKRSAAASHARDKLKDSDPLENYCKENPETDECRTYDS